MTFISKIIIAINLLKMENNPDEPIIQEVNFDAE